MHLRLLVAGAGLLLASGPGLAQPGFAPAPAPATDVLLLTSGQELTGRVLTITPTELTYLPAPPAPAPDTLHLPAASVFLVRYANGTREVLASLTTPASAAQPDLGPPRLRGLSALERRAVGKRDAHLRFQGAGPFWGCLASSACLGPAIGLPDCQVALTPGRVAPYSWALPTFQPLFHSWTPTTITSTTAPSCVLAVTGTK